MGRVWRDAHAQLSAADQDPLDRDDLDPAGEFTNPVESMIESCAITPDG
jgi:hypothetical protein